MKRLANCKTKGRGILHSPPEQHDISSGDSKKGERKRGDATEKHISTLLIISYRQLRFVCPIRKLPALTPKNTAGFRQKSARRLEFSAVLAEISKRLVDFCASEADFFNKVSAFSVPDFYQSNYPSPYRGVRSRCRVWVAYFNTSGR